MPPGKKRILGGTVSFFDGTDEVGNVNIDDGVACFATGKLTAGEHTMHAYYTDDPNFCDTAETEPVTIQVAPAPLQITADNAQKTFGDPDPGFTITATGFVLNDNLDSLSGDLAFATNEPIGCNAPASWCRMPSGLSSPNYNITFAAGTLDVTRTS